MIKDNVLLIDSQDPNHLAILGYLQESGYQVEPAANSIDVILKTLEQKFDFLIFDLSNEDDKEFERLFHRMRLLHPKMKILVMVDDEQAAQEMDLTTNADASLVKASLPDRLLIAMQHLSRAS